VICIKLVKEGGRKETRDFFLLLSEEDVEIIIFFLLVATHQNELVRSFLTRQKGYVGVMFRHHLALCARRARIINLIV
jgi:hypothetical protein